MGEQQKMNHRVLQVTPLSIPQRNASFWRKDLQLNKEYEKSIQSDDLDEVTI